MRRLQYIIGLAGVVAFVLSGQVLRLHHPAMHTMPDGPRMVFVSRHIYLLCASLLNLAMGMYVRIEARGWRRPVQIAGSALVRRGAGLTLRHEPKSVDHLEFFFMVSGRRNAA